MTNISDAAAYLLEDENYTSSSNFSSQYSNLSSSNGTEDAHFGSPNSNPWWIQILVQILYGIVCIVGLCGNTLVIYVVVRFSKMQTVTNLYIVNLAIADECFLVGIPFLMTTISIGYWPFGNYMCKAYFTSTSINQITSSMFLLIMSADRYLAVCHPISAARWRTPFIAKLVALTAWTISALIMVPIYMYANTLEIDNKINCNIFWPESGHLTGQMIFIIYSFILSFAIPLTLILIFYVLVIRRLRTVGPKRRPPQPSSNANLVGAGSDPNNGQPPPTLQQTNRARDRKRSHRKVTKLVLTVITVYFLCWVFYWISQMALIFTTDGSNHSGAVLTMFLLAGCLSYSNSAMNPILYAFLSENFKKSFMKACTCAKGKDVNAALHVENSVFPRGKKGSERHRKMGVGTGATSATSAATTGAPGIGCGSMTGAATIATTTTTTTSAISRNLLQVPQIPPSKSSIDYDDSNGESEDEGVAILGSSENNKNNCRIISDPVSAGIHPDDTHETLIQDGVHVTAL